MASPTETKSLRRQIKSASACMARRDLEHSQELNIKNTIIFKKIKRINTLETSITSLTSERYHLKETLQDLNTRAEATQHELVQLQRECKLLCSEKDKVTSRLHTLEEAMRRQPEVTRDLGDLLEI